MRLGIDVGSTTVKLALLDQDGKIIFSKYERHMSNVFSKVTELIEELSKKFEDIKVQATITGSGGLSLASLLGVSFEQEVVACSTAVERLIPETDVAVELGGEDAKITFYGESIEQRMNGTCAGGTGAFIDQMAILLNSDAAGLNEAAKNYKIIYPIAARCGVFAKTDIQPLLNEGASIEDISVSVFQAVVNQTIGGLACGRPIKGNVAFLGGPLAFLSELRKRFIETLGLLRSQIIFPENSEYFVAIGAAMMADKREPQKISQLLQRVKNANPDMISDTKYLEPLFKNEEDFNEFSRRYEKNKIKRRDIKDATGKVFLGIDAGSTTTKATVIDEENYLLFSYYQNNEGKPLDAIKNMLRELYAVLPESACIANSTVTGYGEGLVQTAFKVDHGEIETMAHFKAAEEFLPGVEFILDIGGQDMKCMEIKDGAIYNIMLNEACSSGCGSFIETYAKSVDLDVEEFAKEGIFAKTPVDLGTRCTVFMNSKVKQAQKEGATIGDISAGLSYSVIKNAIYKVIKLRNTEDAGDKIVVQGGTFINNAVLRSTEKIFGKPLVRPDIAGLMGAYGAALIAKEKYDGESKSKIISLDEMETFSVDNFHTRCNSCENKCLLTINKFSSGSKFVTGNRCEKGTGSEKTHDHIPNMYDYKLKRLFAYEPLSEESAHRGTIGIPRILNMYENYPFWFTFFTKLGFRVVLSPYSTKEIYENGMETISSDTACYPAKIAHGHVKWLVENGIKSIFYPCINYERIEDETAQNHYNCPIVATYPEVINNNMDDLLEEAQVKFLHPFLPYDNDKKLVKSLFANLSEFKIPIQEISRAVKDARAEDELFKSDVRKEGDRALRYARGHKKKSIILAGRPYHLDPEINKGIDKLITSFDMVVLSEDSVAHIPKLNRPIRVLDQWMYHSRLYRAAEFAGNTDDVEIIQLNSFGCGLDAVTTDQVEEMLKNMNKLYTVIKIDEGTNLGAAKIRVRSLKAAIEAREKHNIKPVVYNEPYRRKFFSSEMRKTHTILIPQMSPIHFQFIEAALGNSGYNVELLPPVDKNAVEEGLRYINNDACYPTIVSLGQIISALKSGKYDLDKTAVLMSQTGGGCRASNYVALLRKALTDLEMEQIPVVSVNMVGLEKNPGFKLSVGIFKRMLMSMIYGDVFMRVLFATRPYEQVSDSADELFEKWSTIAMKNVRNGNIGEYKKNLKAIVKAFDELPLMEGLRKPKVGVVGEILVKYHPTANNDIVGIIEREGGEAVVLDLIDFFLYGMLSDEYNYKYLSGTYKKMMISKIGIKFMEKYRKPARIALSESKRFEQPLYIEQIAERAERILSIGNQCGEGWLLTGEMIDLIDHGVENIACLQPFACLPNHVTGKGMIKALRKYNPLANIVAIDYDPGASDVNQLNRIKLMMATAHKNLEKRK